MNTSLRGKEKEPFQRKKKKKKVKLKKRGDLTMLEWGATGAFVEFST